MASRLFALDGAEVVEVDEEPGGGRTVWVVTADPGARVCPVCQTPSAHVREWVATRPADVAHWSTPGSLEAVTSGKVGAHGVEEAASR